MSLLFDTDTPHALRNEDLECRRFGRIFYSNEFLKTAPDVVKKLYTRMVPISVTYDYARELFEVIALSDQFDPVEPAYQIPYYAVRVQRVKRANGFADHIFFDKLEVE